MSLRDSDWFDEIDLDPAASSLAMGTRALGARPWLIADSRREAELALKAELCTHRHDEVFAAGPQATAAGTAALELVRAGGAQIAPVAAHPLEVAGRSVQEDLCLMERHDDGWHLVAASLCFPSRWRLAHKIGRHVTDVHGPVSGYEAKLARRVDSLFDRLTSNPVWRRNWFIHADGALFQPEAPAVAPVVPAAATGSGLFLRSERQTLRTVLPGWILFTIRVQQAPLGAFMADAERSGALAGWVAAVSQADAERRGVSVAQREELRRALA